MYAVMFYVTLNKRKRLGDCVTLSGRAAHTVMFLNMRYMPAMHHAVKCQGAASVRSCRLPDLFVVWSGVMRLSSVGSLPLAKNALHSPTSTWCFGVQARTCTHVSTFGHVQNYAVHRSSPVQSSVYIYVPYRKSIVNVRAPRFG